MKNINKDQELPLKKIDNDKAHKYGEICLVKNDLAQVKQCCVQLLERLDKNSGEITIVDISLWDNALVTFFRCFKQGLRKYKLSKDLFKDLQGEPLKVFDYFENLRDKHIAHPVNIFEEVQVGVVYNPENKEVTGTGHLLTSRILEEKKQVQNLLEFVNIALKKVNTELKEEDKELLNWAKDQDPKEIEAWETARYVVPEPLKAAKKNRKQRKD